MGGLPMGNARHDQGVDISKNGCEIFSFDRRIRRQCVSDLTRLDTGENRERFHLFVIICNPIHHGFAETTEIFRAHVIIFGLWHGSSGLKVIES